MFCIALLYGGLKQVLLALQMGDGSARGGCVWDGDTTARGATDRRNMVRRVWLAATPWPLFPLSLGVAWLTCTELHLLLSKPNFTSSKGPQGKSILAMYIPIVKTETRKKQGHAQKRFVYSERFLPLPVLTSGGEWVGARESEHRHPRLQHNSNFAPVRSNQKACRMHRKGG